MERVPHDAFARAVTLRVLWSNCKGVTEISAAVHAISVSGSRPAAQKSQPIRAESRTRPFGINPEQFETGTTFPIAQFRDNKEPETFVATMRSTSQSARRTGDRRHLERRLSSLDETCGTTDARSGPFRCPPAPAKDEGTLCEHLTARPMLLTGVVPMPRPANLAVRSSGVDIPSDKAGNNNGARLRRPRGVDDCLLGRSHHPGGAGGSRPSGDPARYSLSRYVDERADRQAARRSEHADAGTPHRKRDETVSGDSAQ